MTRDDIINMAEEAGITEFVAYYDLKAFATLIAAFEREACAKLCEELYKPYGTGPADAIRARGNK